MCILILFIVCVCVCVCSVCRIFHIASTKKKLAYKAAGSDEGSLIKVGFVSLTTCTPILYCDSLQETLVSFLSLRAGSARPLWLLCGHQQL